jgi:hypothetical protein
MVAFGIYWDYRSLLSTAPLTEWKSRLSAPRGESRKLRINPQLRKPLTAAVHNLYLLRNAGRTSWSLHEPRTAIFDWGSCFSSSSIVCATTQVICVQRIRLPSTANSPRRAQSTFKRQPHVAALLPWLLHNRPVRALQAYSSVSNY